MKHLRAIPPRPSVGCPLSPPPIRKSERETLSLWFKGKSDSTEVSTYRFITSPLNFVVDTLMEHVSPTRYLLNTLTWLYIELGTNMGAPMSHLCPAAHYQVDTFHPPRDGRPQLILLMLVGSIGQHLYERMNED